MEGCSNSKGISLFSVFDMLYSLYGRVMIKKDWDGTECIYNRRGACSVILGVVDDTWAKCFK